MSEVESVAWDGRWFDDARLLQKTGARVRVSAEGRAANITAHPYRLGVIARASRDPRFVNVRWDGTKTTQRWSARFVEAP